MKLSNAVEDYINKQPSPNKEICQRLRGIILKTFPDIKEQMKLGVPWYEGKYYIVALKDHVNLGFSIRGLSREEVSSFSGSGKTMKVIEIRSVDEIDESDIIRLLKIVR
jgi:hypothetical protein